MSEVVLPKSVKKKIEEAEELQKKLFSSSDSGEESDEAGGQELADGGDTAETSSADNENKAVDTPATSEDTGGASQADEPSSDAKLWEQRYKSLAGEHKAALARHTAEIGELRAQMAEMQAELEAAKSRSMETPGALPEVSLSDEDIELVGEDAVEVMRKVAAEAVSAFTKRLDALESSVRELSRLANSLPTVESKVKSVEEKEYVAALQKGVHEVTGGRIELDAVLADERFKQWLMEFDPLLGRQRFEAVAEAEAAFDAPRVLAFIRAFLDGVGVTAGRKSDKALAAEISPGRSKGASDKPKAVLSPADIQQEMARLGEAIRSKAPKAAVDPQVAKEVKDMESQLASLSKQLQGLTTA